tara:strand:- start:52 stop:690 length:639 start_codon:yes stop_codon:yes gene_type:complete
MEYFTKIENIVCKSYSGMEIERNKKQRKPKPQKVLFEKFNNEITCLNILRNNFEKKYYDVFPFPIIKLVDHKNSTFFMNRCGKSIYKFPRDDNEEHARKLPQIPNVIDQLNNIFYNLKKCNILYKDIHPGNVCVDTNGCIYLIDFEVAFIMDYENYENVITFNRGSYKWSDEYYNNFYSQPTDLNIYNNLNLKSPRREWKAKPWSIYRMLIN